MARFGHASLVAQRLEGVLDADQVERAPDHEVDEVVDCLRAVVEARIVAPARRGSRPWIVDSGVSRGTSTSLRSSFRALRMRPGG